VAGTEAVGDGGSSEDVDVDIDVKVIFGIVWHGFIFILISSRSSLGPDGCNGSRNVLGFHLKKNLWIRDIIRDITIELSALNICTNIK